MKSLNTKYGLLEYQSGLYSGQYECLNILVDPDNEKYEPSIDLIFDDRIKNGIYNYCYEDFFEGYIQESTEVKTKNLDKEKFIELLKIKYIIATCDGGSEVGIRIENEEYDLVLIRIYFDANQHLDTNQLDIHWE